MPPGKGPKTEVLFEFRKQGGSVRVSAIDARTGIEATIVGDPHYGMPYLKQLALRKLRYVLAKQRRAGQPPPKRDPWEGL